MKKILKGNLKRWIAFLLAVVLIATTCVYSSDAFLRAEGDETQAENQAEPASEEVEVIPTEVDEPEQDPEPEAEESNEEETEEEPVEEDVVEIPAEAPEEPDVNPEETTTPEVLPESPETTPEQPADPSVSPAIDPSASPSVSPSAVPSASPEKEEGEVYSYTICYYYDGVEDEDARVEKEDGVLGEKILASVKVEGEVTVDGKDYKLDKIENKNGEITEEAKDNIVSIYYILADEPDSDKELDKDVVYTLKFKSSLSEGGKAEVVSVDGEKADGKDAYKEGAEVTFEVYVNEGYLLSTVADQNGTELKVDSQNKKDGVYTYVVTMAEDKVITVTYEKVEDQQEAKEEMPAQTMKASAGKVAVTVDAPEGVLPEGTVVEAVAVDGDDVSEAVISALEEKGLIPVEITAVDITLTKDGGKVSPKGDVTVKLDNVFTSDVPGTEAAIYYVNGSSAEYVGGADPSASSVEFSTNHFSVYAAVKVVSADEYEVDALAETEDKGVKRGIRIIHAGSNKAIYLEGEWGNSGDDHKWEIEQNDLNMQITSENYNSARVEVGDTTGTASVIHTYGNQREYWDVVVIPEPEGGMVQRVYIFVEVKADVDTTGWTLNEHGFYTVGYVDVPTDFIINCEFNFEKIADYVKGEMKSNLHSVNNTININLSDVKWEDVIKDDVNGADEFVDVSNEKTWHLDGVIELTSGSYTVKYYCDDEEDGRLSHEVTETIKKDADEVPVNSNKIKGNPFGDEYEFDCYKINGEKYYKLPETVEKDAVIEVHYKGIKKLFRLYYSGGTGVSKDPVYFEYEEGTKITVKAPDGLLQNSNEKAVFAKLWKSSVDGNFVKDGDKFIMPGKDVTLTAQWKILTVDKEVAGIYNKDGDKKDKAGVGDTVKFNITVTNAGDVDLKNVSVTDNGVSAGNYTNHEVTVDKELIDTLKAGKTEVIEASYTVTKEEVGKTDVINKVTVEEGDVKVEAETGIQMEEADKQLFVEKKIVKPESATGEDGKYRTGDTVWFDVTVINTGNIALNDIWVEEDTAFKDAVIHKGSGYSIKDNKAVIGNLEPGDDHKVVISVSYEIKEADLGKTDFRNIVTVATKDIEDKKEAKSDPIPVEDKEIDIKLNKSIKKISDKDGAQISEDQVKEGSVIYYEIEIENVGNVDLHKLNVRDILSKTLGNKVDSGQVKIQIVSGNAEVTINGNEAVITKLPCYGESQNRNITLGCSYTVTGDDAGKRIDNTVIVSPQENPELEWKDEAESVKVNGFGYQINYYYDGKIASEETVEVTDAIYDAPIEYISEGTAFEKMHNSESYMFIEAKIGDKVIAKVNGRGSEAKLEAAAITATSDNQIIDVYYVKDSNGPEGKPDRIPDSEEYSVTYHPGRNGVGEIHNSYLYPEGYSVTASQNIFTNTNANAAFAYWKSDVDNMEIIDPDASFEMPNHNVTLTAQWKALGVVKKVDQITNDKNGVKETAGINDRVDFIITVKNEGDIPLKEVTVSDDGLSVEGNSIPSTVIIDGNGNYRVEENKAVIASLSENAEVEIKAHYIVTENEIGKTNVTNKATAQSDGIKGTGETDPIPMEGVDWQLTVTKEIVDRDKTATGDFENGSDGLRLYTTGDTVRFEVTVTNTGNQTLTDITIEDLLAGANIESGSWLFQLINGYAVADGKPVIKELKPLESAVFKASYVIQETDLGRKFYNTVSAKSDDGEWAGNSEEIPVEDKKPAVKAEKRLSRIVDPDGNEVAGRAPKEGDVIHYQIEVENVGNMDLENVRVEDILHVSPEDEVEDRQVTFEEIPGVTLEGNAVIIAKLDYVDTNGSRKITLNCSYQVRRDDAGKVIMNGIKVSSDTKKPDGSNLDVEKPEEEVEVTVQNLYTLTVNYVYEAGGTAAASYAGQYYGGEIYRVDSPVIDGYNRVAFVAGQMPDNDLVMTVVYAAVATPPAPGGDPAPDPVDPDTPPVPPVTPVDEVPDPVVPPVVPEGPAVPEAPVVPGTPETVLITAPAAPALVAVGDAPVPLQGALIETDDDGNVTVTPITEDEIPLANKEIDDHKCCILSFLLMLATLIIYSWFTHSMKKRQKKLAELKDQLAEETLKRQLGITDKTSNRR